MLESYNYIQFKHKYTVVSLFDWCEHLTCDACMHFTIYTDTWWAVKLVAFQWEWISAFQYTARIAFFTSTTLSFGQWTTADEISIHKVKATLIHCGNDHLFTDHHTLFVFIFSVSSLLCFPLDSNSTKHFQRYHSFYLHKAILTTCVTLKSKWISFNNHSILYI